MTTDTIKAAIPHREPMLLVDEIVQQTTDTITCRKTFREDEFFVQGHYPDFPLVPGAILCECAMQAGAILLSEVMQQADGVPVATRLNNVKFTRMVRPGDTIEMDIKLSDQLSGAYFLTARVTVDGQLAARMDFACAAATLP